MIFRVVRWKSTVVLYRGWNESEEGGWEGFVQWGRPVLRFVAGSCVTFVVWDRKQSLWKKKMKKCKKCTRGGIRFICVVARELLLALGAVCVCTQAYTWWCLFHWWVVWPHTRDAGGHLRLEQTCRRGSHIYLVDSRIFQSVVMWVYREGRAAVRGWL
jgi:hypothetical protein